MISAHRDRQRLAEQFAAHDFWILHRQRRERYIEIARLQPLDQAAREVFGECDLDFRMPIAKFSESRGEKERQNGRIGADADFASRTVLVNPQKWRPRLQKRVAEFRKPRRAAPRRTR